jgi:hypothetical protein
MVSCVELRLLPPQGASRVGCATVGVVVSRDPAARVAAAGPHPPSSQRHSYSRSRVVLIDDDNDINRCFTSWNPMHSCNRPDEHRNRGFNSVRRPATRALISIGIIAPEYFTEQPYGDQQLHFDPRGVIHRSISAEQVRQDCCRALPGIRATLRLPVSRHR